MKKKNEIKIDNLVYVFILIFLICLFVYSMSNIVIWFIDNKATVKQIEYIYENIEIEEKEETEDTVIIEPEDEIEETNYYWDYIKTSYIDVDINELTKINSDTVAWLKLEGTNINYPVVQYSDNEYYLNRSFDKTYNTAGWIFADYRNESLISSKNYIIYGHGRISSVMFGTLKNIITNGWLDDTNNFLVKLSTETENTVWQVFSVYETSYTTDYLTVNFYSDVEFNEFANMLMTRSEFDFGTTINGSDQIITLSTCYGDAGSRLVLHAKLIKSEEK